MSDESKMEGEIFLVRLDERLRAFADRFEMIIRGVDAKHETLGDRVSAVENGHVEINKELLIQRGRNQVIMWALGLLGAPLIVTLAGLGIAKLVGISS